MHELLSAGHGNAFPKVLSIGAEMRCSIFGGGGERNRKHTHTWQVLLLKTQFIPAANGNQDNNSCFCLFFVFLFLNGTDAEAANILGQKHFMVCSHAPLQPAPHSEGSVCVCVCLLIHLRNFVACHEMLIYPLSRTECN